MGQLLAEIYKIVEEKGGTSARLKLATETGLPLKDAAEMKEKPELIEKFKAIASDILNCDINDFLGK